MPRTAIRFGGGSVICLRQSPILGGVSVGGRTPTVITEGLGSYEVRGHTTRGDHADGQDGTAFQA